MLPLRKSYISSIIALVFVSMGDCSHAENWAATTAQVNGGDALMHQKAIQKTVDDQIWVQLESADWVVDGKKNAPRIVYTFSDPSCPYCNRFWHAARPWVETGKVQLRHLIVGIIKIDSPAKAAAILEAPDRAAALYENESKAGQGGIKPLTTISASTLRILDANKALLVSMGFRGTPSIIIRDNNGELKRYKGMPQDEELIEILGPR